MVQSSSRFSHYLVTPNFCGLLGTPKQFLSYSEQFVPKVQITYYQISVRKLLDEIGTSIEIKPQGNSIQLITSMFTIKLQSHNTLFFFQWIIFVWNMTGNMAIYKGNKIKSFFDPVTFIFSSVLPTESLEANQLVALSFTIYTRIRYVFWSSLLYSFQVRRNIWGRLGFMQKLGFS